MSAQLLSTRNQSAYSPARSHKHEAHAFDSLLMHVIQRLWLRHSASAKEAYKSEPGPQRAGLSEPRWSRRAQSARSVTRPRKQTRGECQRVKPTPASTARCAGVCALSYLVQQTDRGDSRGDSSAQYAPPRSGITVPVRRIIWPTRGDCQIIPGARSNSKWCAASTTQCRCRELFGVVPAHHRADSPR
jgi:hypothetical protein